MSAPPRNVHAFDGILFVFIMEALSSPEIIVNTLTNAIVVLFIS